jgi:nucleotide-binding universal stress UspA family protein
MRVLVATDGSSGARAAVDWLARSFPGAGATVTVVSVAAGPPAVGGGEAERLRAVATSVAERAVGEARAALSARWPEADGRVLDGDPREELARLAEAERADLLVVGAAGLGGVRRFLLGSVSRAMVRHAPCPVLVVKGSAARTETAIVAVDGSSHALEAVRYFAALGLELAGGVLVLGVVEPVRWPKAKPVALSAQVRQAARELGERRRSEMQQAVAQAAAALRERATPVETVLSEGRPAQKIVETARKRGAGLVVVGARGVGTMMRLVLGSVSEAVLNDAPCPVLVVRAKRATTGGVP